MVQNSGGHLSGFPISTGRNFRVKLFRFDNIPRLLSVIAVERMPFYTTSI